MSDNIFKRIAIVITHMKSLNTRHTILEGQIAVEHSRNIPDQNQLRWLKVRRLMVRDQIARYETILKNLRTLLTDTKIAKAAFA